MYVGVQTDKPAVYVVVPGMWRWGCLEVKGHSSTTIVLLKNKDYFIIYRARFGVHSRIEESLYIVVIKPKFNYGVELWFFC